MPKDLNEFNLTALLEEEGFLDPVRLRRIFLMLTREHFSNPENYLNESLKPIVYNDSSDQSSLDIDLDFIYDADEIGKKPAIYIGTTPFNFKKQVINNASASSDDNSVEFYTTECTTAINIRHITTAADLSLQLATQSVNFFGCLRAHLMSMIPGILQYEIAQLTPPALIEQSKIRVFQSNITINFAFNSLWASSIEGHRLKRIIFTHDLGFQPMPLEDTIVIEPEVELPSNEEIDYTPEPPPPPTPTPTPTPTPDSSGGTLAELQGYGECDDYEDLIK